MVDSFADFSDIIVTAVLQMITAKQLQHFVQRTQLWENGTSDSLRDRSHKVDGEIPKI